MKDFDKIGKRMPYAESEDYLEGLIEASTETAITRQQPKTRIRRIQWIAAAASVAIVAAVGTTIFIKHQSAVSTQTDSPLDVYLCNLSDDDAQLIDCYEIEEIPEY